MCIYNCFTRGDFTAQNVLLTACTHLGAGGVVVLLVLGHVLGRVDAAAAGAAAVGLHVVQSLRLHPGAAAPGRRRRRPTHRRRETDRARRQTPWTPARAAQAHRLGLDGCAVREAELVRERPGGGGGGQRATVQRAARLEVVVVVEVVAAGTGGTVLVGELGVVGHVEQRRVHQISVHFVCRRAQQPTQTLFHGVTNGRIGLSVAIGVQTTGRCTIDPAYRKAMAESRTEPKLKQKKIMKGD